MKKTIIVMALIISGLMATPSICGVFADNPENIEMHQGLTQEEAQELLKKDFNENLKYIYQGNEEKFDALQNKGLKGYVFLPDVDTDIGLFVDCQSGQIYEFHPSGYLNLIK